MRIIKDRQIVYDDWTLVREVVTDDEVSSGKVIVPLAYWQQHRDVLIETNEQHAIWIDGDNETEALLDDLSNFDLIALDFPTFKDGRSYSHARLLRQRYGFEKELRAIGDILRDQLFYLMRCGFNSFELRQDKDAEDALKAFNDFTVRYQAAADDAVPVYKLR